MRNVKILAAAAALIGAGTFAAPAMATTNLVVNGDFEGGQNPGSGRYCYFGYDSSSNAANGGGGVCAPGSFFGTSGLRSPGQGGFAPSDLSASGFVQVDGTLSQTLADITAGVYRLTFSDFGRTNSNQGNQTYTVTIGGIQVGGIFSTVSGVGSSYDLLFSLPNLAAPVLTFTGLSVYPGPGPAGGDNTAYIDNIVLSAAPEPATWAMMVLGFGLVGFALRKRSKALTTVSYA